MYSGGENWDHHSLCANPHQAPTPTPLAPALLFSWVKVRVRVMGGGRHTLRNERAQTWSSGLSLLHLGTHPHPSRAERRPGSHLTLAQAPPSPALPPPKEITISMPWRQMWLEFTSDPALPSGHWAPVDCIGKLPHKDTPSRPGR